MARTPGRYRPPMGSRDSAEAAFKSATTKPPEEPARRHRRSRVRPSLCRCASRATCWIISRRRRPGWQDRNHRGAAQGGGCLRSVVPATGCARTRQRRFRPARTSSLVSGFVSGVRNTDCRNASVSASVAPPGGACDDDERPGLESSCSIPEWKQRSPARVGLSSDLLPGDFTATDGARCRPRRRGVAICCGAGRRCAGAGLRNMVPQRGSNSRPPHYE